MRIERLSRIFIAGLIVLGGAGFAVAQDLDPASLSPEQAVEARQATMKDNGATLRAAGALSGAEAVAAAERLIEHFVVLPGLFPEGSLVGETRALPAIWEDFDTFTGLFAQAAAAATAMKTAAEAGDAAGYAEAVKTVGATCGQCHQQFRQPS